MYDLGDLRAQIREFIEGLGWRAVMSEHDSFAIDANETTVENSLRNVRENTDIFVMIVGARYGSIDSQTDKSVTNLEFLEARAGGAPAYVFVDSDVLPLLSVWRNNPDSDYSGIVDTPRVFEFIDSFYESGEVWTFPFAAPDDIVNTLRQQFAYLVQDALALRQSAQDHHRLPEGLEGTSLRVALRRDDGWEYRLFGTVLETELDRLAPIRREIEYRLAPTEVTYVGLDDLASWMQDRLHEAGELGETAAAILNNYLPQALGEPGEHGDPSEIVACACRLAQVWEDCAHWTLRCRSVRVEQGAERVVDALSNSTANMLDEIWEFGHAIIPRLSEAIRALAEGGTETVEMTLTLTADLDQYNDEFARYKRSLDS